VRKRRVVEKKLEDSRPYSATSTSRSKQLSAAQSTSVNPCQKMLRSLASSSSASLRQLPRRSLSTLTSRSTRSAGPVAASLWSRSTIQPFYRSLSTSRVARDEAKPEPPKPLPAVYQLNEADVSRLTRLRNVGISAHIDSGESRCLSITCLPIIDIGMFRQNYPHRTYPLLHWTSQCDP